MAIPCMHMDILCMAIPHVAHGKLHETCMFHATRKCGPCKHMTECIVVFCGTMHGHVSKSEVIIQWYHIQDHSFYTMDS